MRELNIVGAAVSMPHKQSVMKLLDEIDPTAETIGASTQSTTSMAHSPDTTRIGSRYGSH